MNVIAALFSTSISALAFLFLGASFNRLFIKKWFLSVNGFSILLAVFVGQALFSTLLSILGLFHLFHSELIQGLNYLFALLGLVILFKHQKNWLDSYRSYTKIEKIYLSIFAAVIIFFCAFGAVMNQVHGDALQYHYALPWLYLQKNFISFEPGIEASGQLIAGDILYALAINQNDPWSIFNVNALNAFLNILLFPALYYLVRELGGSRIWGLVACCLIFWIPCIDLSMSGKNDLAIVAIAIISLITILQYASGKIELAPHLMLLVGYCFAFKLNGFVFVFMALISFFILHSSFRSSVFSSLKFLPLALLTSAPWIYHSLKFRNTPVYPFFYHYPQYIWDIGKLRNNTGLIFSWPNFFSELIPLTLGTSSYSSQNSSASLGIIFLITLLIGLFLLFKNFKKEYLALLITVIVFWLLFVYTKFENYMLMRYLLFCPVVTIAVMSAQLSKYVDGFLIFLIAAVASFLSVPAVGIRQYLASTDTLEYLTGKISKQQFAEKFFYPYIFMQKYIDQQEAGSQLLVNDGMVYGLKHFINVHKMHNHYLNIDDFSDSEILKWAEDNKIKAALLRSGTSGQANQDQILKEHYFKRKESSHGYEFYFLN